jgi:hypothetical protein
MPTFVAVVAASIAAYLADELLGGVSVIGSAGVSFLLWVLVFYFTKRWLIRIRS